MPYCPECKFEYRPDITKCPDCEAWLVASLGDANPADNSHDSFSSAPSRAKPEQPDHIKKLMKSLPPGPNIPTGPLSPGTGRSEDNYEPDSNDEIAKKLNQYETWIEIAHLPSEHISRVLSDGLESLGIPCVVMPGARTGAIFGEMSGGLMKSHGNDILLVPEDFVERADIESLELLGEQYEDYKTPHS